MKGPFLLLCISVCILALLIPVTSAACNPPQTTFPTPTVYPPGPYGTIYIESSPAGAYIYLNDEYQGRAPITITGLWPKTYEITAKMSGFETYTATTTITGPTRSSVYCRLTPDNSGSGLVVISSPDKATVFIDGVEKGVTPLSLSNPATGSHTIQLRLAGYEDWKSTADIHEGIPKTISATLIKKTIKTDQGVNVSSSPAGASVTLDGLAKGSTPITLNDLAAGIHIIQLDYPGYHTWKSTITVPETGILDLPVTLDPKSANAPGWIYVSSSPGDASVTLDGSYVGRTPVNSSLNLDSVSAGEHTVALDLSGYQPYSTRASVSQNRVSTVNAVLVPASAPYVKGALSVTSDPAGADVSVDNESVGISPLTKNDIAAGNHLVTIRMDGYQDYSTGILVTAGTTSTVSATLLPVTPSLHTPVYPLSALGALGIIGFFALRKYH
jgi:hypothetical protein